MLDTLPDSVLVNRGGSGRHPFRKNEELKNPHVSDVGESVDEREDESDRAEEHVVEAQRLPRASQYSFSRSCEINQGMYLILETCMRSRQSDGIQGGYRSGRNSPVRRAITLLRPAKQNKIG